MTMSGPASPEDTEDIGVAMPLFGGQDAYVETLEQVLKFTNMANPDKQKLIQWFKISFADVESDDSIGRRISFLTTVNFLKNNDNIFEPGPAGRRYLADESPDVVYNALAHRVDYIEEILAFLTRGEVEIETLQKELDQDYDRAKWKVNWLISMGFANPVDQGTYTATEEGKEVAQTYSPEVMAHMAGN